MKESAGSSGRSARFLNGQNELEPSRQAHFSETSSFEPKQTSSNFPKSRTNEKRAEPGSYQPLEDSFPSSVAGDELDNPTGIEKRRNQLDRPKGSSGQAESEGVANTEKKQFIWSEDLSENAQKLYLLLLSDVGLTEYLSELAQTRGIDLNIGLEELRHLDVLDEDDPTIIRIRWKSQAGL